MANLSWPETPAPSADLSDRAAIVGVGATDFHLDYEAWRAKAPGYAPPSSGSLAAAAFERALADCGLQRADIDGLSVSFIGGGPTSQEMAKQLGLRPRHLIDTIGLQAGPIPVACAAIAAGKCDTLAMVYAAAPRAASRTYGGRTYDDPVVPSSYYYHHPWGWSSQAAHWALVWSHYRAMYGYSDADLGSVAVQLRDHARSNPAAIMRSPLTAEDYLAARYIVKPLRLLDLCLVNDGGICVILRRADRVAGLPHAPVLVSGWGEAKARGDNLHNLVRERLRPQFQMAGEQAFGMAGIAASDVQHFEGYDASTIHLVSHLEGHGFVEPGGGLAFCKAGGMALGGALPTNTGGGMLSEAYMHGWNQVVEIARQLRHEAGARQIPGVEVSMLSVAQTDQVHPVIFRRGAP